MATQTVEFRAASGLTLTVRLFAVGSDTIVQTASAVVESGNRKGTYQSLFADVAAGEYELIALSGTTPVCRWFTTLTLTTATFQAYEVRVQSVIGNVGGNVAGSVNSVTSDVNASATSVRSAVGLAAANLDTQLATKPDAAGIRTAVGLASANLDTQLSAKPDAAGVRSAVGLAAANLDTQLSGIQSDTTTLTGRLTASRALYLDNLNVGGPVASQADINALNQSASRRVILTTLQQLERPETGSTSYQIEARTFDGDGAAVNADSTPTLTATGTLSGNLSGNLSAATNPATGVYRWTYSVANNAVQEQIRFDFSAVISASTFTIAAFSAVVDLVSATWTSTDASRLAAIYNKLPSRAYLTGATAATGELVPADILNQSPSAGWTNGSFGDRLLVAANSNRTAFLTGSQHIAADVHGFQPAVINSAALAASAITAIQSGLATSTALATAQSDLDDIQIVVSQVKLKTDNLPSDPADQSAVEAAIVAATTGLATLNNQNTIIQLIDTEIAGIKSVTDKINTGLIQDGAVWQFTANMLENGPTGGGGGASGPGSDQVTILISDNGVPIDDVSVWVSLDSAGSNVIAGSLVTNTLGKVTFLLNAGATYYLWAEKSGMSPIVGRSFVAVADS